MDEIRKIPPVTRSLLSATALVTLPCILQLTSPYKYILHWPFVFRQYELWRPLTAFFYGGSGLALLFDIFLLFRNSSDLEENRFFRKTSKYAWALIVTGAMILGLNYPLKTMVLWSPMLNALTYLWANANPTARMNFFGVVTVPAKWVPYAYLGMDLIRGGPDLAIQSATGLLAAHGYVMLTAAHEGARGRGGWATFLVEPPAFLQQLLPDSVDPALGPGPTPTGGAGRSTAFGSAFAPRGRSFGEGNSGRTLAGSGGGSGASGSGGGLWSTVTGMGSGSSSSRAQAPPSRDDILAAAERRLRAQADNSIIGRHARSTASSSSSSAAPSSSAGNSGPLASGKDSRTSALPSNNPSEAVRRTAAGTSQAFTFGQLAAREEKSKDPNTQEDASGSGGRVAEQRREKPRPPAQKAPPASPENSSQTQWPGSGRKLGDQ